jgi:hypothetical protein
VSHRPYWTPLDKETALAMRAEGCSDWEISVRIGRTKKAVNAFLANKARQQAPCRKSVDPACAQGPAIGFCKEDRRAKEDAVRGSEKLLCALLRMVA